MPFWKISGQVPERVPETRLKDEKILEERLEDWITSDPSILGEPLLIIGRQVQFPDVKDKLDLLALDPQGKAVAIELKRGKLKDPVDMQVLRYASYLAKWRFEDFEKQAIAYLNPDGNRDFSFNSLFEEFCSKAGLEEAPDINSDQRLVLLGAEVRDKLGSVALWLRDHTIDIKVIEIEAFRENDTLFLQPSIIVPLPISRFAQVGKAPVGDVSKPWLADGRSWHLDKRCGPKTREMLLVLDEVIRNNCEVEGPNWSQKNYLSYTLGDRIWIYVDTKPKSLVLNMIVPAGTFDKTALATSLQVAEFNEEEELGEKLNLPTSVNIRHPSDDSDRVVLRIKEGFDVSKPTFIQFLKKGSNDNSR